MGTVFWLMVGFFALVGVMRGWTKEVVATAGLVLSLFAINAFGYQLTTILSDIPITDQFNEALRRQQFYYLTTIHLTIAFFSYQGPAFAGRTIAERLRVRDSLQDKLLGGLVGGLNGYLIVGTLWGLLEYVHTATGWVAVPGNLTYPFPIETITRPTAALALTNLISDLPLPLLAPYLPYLVVIVFLFVLVVMI
ncbi:MAG: CvpA family protein [Ardenticatenaceae bacterium]|nr:CvpA family protein [Ardenticatenaceae bacterium]